MALARYRAYFQVLRAGFEGDLDEVALEAPVQPNDGEGKIVPGLGRPG